MTLSEQGQRQRDDREHSDVQRAERAQLHGVPERAQDQGGLAGLIRRPASTYASARAEVFQTELIETVAQLDI